MSDPVVYSTMVPAQDGFYVALAAQFLTNPTVLGNLTLTSSVLTPTGSVFTPQQYVTAYTAATANMGMRVGSPFAYVENGGRPNSERAATLISASAVGHAGVMGISRTVDNLNAGSMGSIGVSGFAWNNNSAQVQTGYAGYFEGRRYPGAGTTHGIEVDISNYGSVELRNPYNMAAMNVTPSLWLASGGGNLTGAVNPASMAAGVIYNGGTFLQGFVFGADAIEDNGSGKPAIVFGDQHKIVWHASNTSGEIARIRSDASTAALNIQFSNGKLRLQTLLNDDIFTFFDTGKMRVPVRFNIESPVINYMGMTTAGTVGSAGTASALPSNPVTYLVVEINNVPLKIPAYNI
jgi:hypothetical protein